MQMDVALATSRSLRVLHARGLVHGDLLRVLAAEHARVSFALLGRAFICGCCRKRGCEKRDGKDQSAKSFHCLLRTINGLKATEVLLTL